MSSQLRSYSTWESHIALRALVTNLATPSMSSCHINVWTDRLFCWNKCINCCRTCCTAGHVNSRWCSSPTSSREHLVQILWCRGMPCCLPLSTGRLWHPNLKHMKARSTLSGRWSLRALLRRGTWDGPANHLWYLQNRALLDGLERGEMSRPSHTKSLWCSSRSFTWDMSICKILSNRTWSAM